MTSDDSGFYRAQIFDIVLFFLASASLQIADMVIERPSGHVITNKFMHDLCLIEALRCIKKGCIVALVFAVAGLIVYHIVQESYYEHKGKMIGRILSLIAIPAFLAVAGPSYPLLFGNIHVETITATQSFEMLYHVDSNAQGSGSKDPLSELGVASDLHLIKCNDDILFVYSADEYTVAQDAVS